MSSAERKLLTLVAAVQGILEIGEFREAILGALLEAVPADWVSLNDIGPDPADAWYISKPPIAKRQLEQFAALSHQNPLIQRWLRTRDGRAYRFSDVAEPHELEGLDLFRDFYAPLGIKHQVAFTLPSPADRVLAIALSRSDPDFSDGERDFLNDARPFLIQGYRNALEYSRGVGPTATPPAARLTPREDEVVRLVATGRSNAAVAETLGITTRTVQKHLERAYRKLGVDNRSDASALLWGQRG